MKKPAVRMIRVLSAALLCGLSVGMSGCDSVSLEFFLPEGDGCFQQDIVETQCHVAEVLEEQCVERDVIETDCYTEEVLGEDCIVIGPVEICETVVIELIEVCEDIVVGTVLVCDDVVVEIVEVCEDVVVDSFIVCD